MVDLHGILDQVYQDAALDLAIAYDRQPVPPVSDEDWAWIQALVSDRSED